MEQVLAGNIEHSIGRDMPQQGETWETDFSEPQENAKWANIVAALLLVIAILLIPVFAADEPQQQGPITMAETQAVADHSNINQFDAKRHR